ncbi:MAG: carboxypeptidase-like regulatory domain-containing protein [Vicinamibacterales bacterium]
MPRARTAFLAAALALTCALLSAAARQGDSGAAIPSGNGTPGGRVQGPGGRFGGPVRDNADQPPGTASIRGRILSSDTGTPVRRAQVRAVSNELRTARLASTDAEGRFELKDLPAGRWNLTASKAGFVTLQYGQTRPFESGRAVELTDNQTLTRVDFTLPRGSAITGHVYDEFGDPVAGARVQVLRFQTIQGTRRVTPSGTGDQSDDTGAFRLYGLSPGEYFVSATLRAGPGADNTDGTSYAPTFYPGTGNLAEAQRLTLTVGQEQSSINFALLPVRTVRVSGLVLGASGTPLGNAVVTLASGADTSAAFNMTTAAGRTRPDGTFSLGNVSPGSYTLTATTGFGGGRGGNNASFEIAALPVIVGNDDLTGVTVLTSKGGSITGRLAAAEGSSGQLRTGNVQVVAQTVRFEAGPGAGARPARVESDGTFRLTGLMGPRVLRVNGLPQEWMLKAVMLNGTDVTDATFDFKGNEDLSGAQILVTDRVSEVNGKVTLNNQPTRDFTVVIFPDDPAKWEYPSRYIRSGRGDEQGQFRIRPLPAEQRYLAIAVDYLEDGEATDPQFLEQMADRATRFGLIEGESKALDLKLIQR